MSAYKIKKGDTVKVIAGKDKDKEGKVIAVDTKNHRVLVEGVNMVTKHTKPSAANQQLRLLQKRRINANPAKRMQERKRLPLMVNAIWH